MWRMRSLSSISAKRNGSASISGLLAIAFGIVTGMTITATTMMSSIWMRKSDRYNFWSETHEN